MFKQIRRTEEVRGLDPQKIHYVTPRPTLSYYLRSTLCYNTSEEVATKKNRLKIGLDKIISTVNWSGRKKNWRSWRLNWSSRERSGRDDGAQAASCSCPSHHAVRAAEASRPSGERFHEDGEVLAPTRSS